MEQKQQKINQNKQKYSFSFFTGGIAGICGKTIIAPFERIKFLYVTRSHKFSYCKAFEDMLYIYRKNGILDFFRGNGANCLRVFPFASINFSVFDYLRNNFYKPLGNETSFAKKTATLFLCGSFSGMTATFLTYPLEFVRTRMAMEKSNFTYKNVFNGINVIHNQEGFRSMYSGLTMALLGVFVYHGFAFFCVNNIKQFILDNRQNIYKKWYVDFGVGSVASAFGQAISYPIDIVRKRLQSQRFLLNKGEINQIYTIPHLIRHIYTNEGAIGFYKGLSINLIKGPLATGTVWTIKNKLNRKLDKNYDL